ncbi:hypothetical protein [Rhizobium sp. RCAM05973]|uniref:hypothetical protein n=1 Tax=Rhizobium sp. RCAM05973 TaxID=2994066 RepID=UPI0022EBE9CA|nr:hypothetical protein [Rhizobium sp. RCAM05973]
MTVGANDLVTIAQAYAWLGVPSGTDDTNMQFAVTAFSTLIATWCSRNFVQASYSEVYDGHGGPRLMVRNWPITAVSSLAINGQAVSLANGPLGSGYLFSDRSVVMNDCNQFWRGFQNIAISYTAGFNPIPMDLQLACLEWMKATYLFRTEALPVTSRRAGDTEEKYASPVTMLLGEAAPMPPTVYAVLSQYRDTLPV